MRQGPWFHVDVQTLVGKSQSFTCSNFSPNSVCAAADGIAKVSLEGVRLHCRVCFFTLQPINEGNATAFRQALERDYFPNSAMKTWRFTWTRTRAERGPSGCPAWSLRRQDVGAPRCRDVDTRQGAGTWVGAWGSTRCFIGGKGSAPKPTLPCPSRVQRMEPCPLPVREVCRGLSLRYLRL